MLLIIMDEKLVKLFCFLLIFKLCFLANALDKFFPLGIYSVNPPQEFKEIKEAGFNVVQTYELDKSYLAKFIKEAKKFNLKVLIFPSARIKMKNYNLKKIKNFVSKYKSEDAILGWYLVEEPKWQRITKNEITNLNNLIKKIDRKHFSVIFVSQPDYVLDYSDKIDIVMTGIYPVPRARLIEVARVIEKAKLSRLPVWAVIQAFGYQDENHKGWGWQREPTLTEMRLMAYLAIAHGAQGLFFYTYHGSQYYIKLSPHYWQEVKNLVKELKQNIPIFLAPSQKLEIKKGKNLYSHYIAKEVGKRLYIYLINPFLENLKLKLSLSNQQKEYTLSPYEVKKIIVRR